MSIPGSKSTADFGTQEREAASPVTPAPQVRVELTGLVAGKVVAAPRIDGGKAPFTYQLTGDAGLYVDAFGVIRGVSGGAVIAYAVTDALGRQTSVSFTPGASGVTPPVGGSAAFTSSAAQSQPGATLRFFQATLDRAASLTGISDNATIWDAVNGLWALKLATAGDGTAARSAQVTLTATPADGSGAVTQTVTVSLGVVSVPAQVSEHGSSLFTGIAGKKLEASAGWALYGNAGPSNYATDGSGALINDGSSTFNGSLLLSPLKMEGLTGSFTFKKGDSGGNAYVALVANGNDNAFIVAIQTNDNGLFIAEKFAYQGGSGGIDGQSGLGFFQAWDANGNARLLFEVSSDKKTLKVGMGAVDNGFAVDLTKYTNLGPKLGFISGKWYGNPALSGGLKLAQVEYAVQQSVLTVTSAPGNTSNNQATYALSWTGTKPTVLQHSFDGDTWFTGESTINNDGTASYVATASSTGKKTVRIRMMNDIGVVAFAPNATRFLGPAAQFGVNVAYPGPYSPQFQVLDNLFYQGYWIVPTPAPGRIIADYTPDLTCTDIDMMPLVSGMARAIGRGPVSGGYVLMTWTGAPNMTVYQGHSEDASIDDVSHPDAQSFKFRQNFTSGQPTNSFVSLAMDFDPANPPKNIRIRPVGQSDSIVPYLSDAYIDHHCNDYGPPLVGCLRGMDWLEVNNIRTDITFASIERRLNMLINLANAVKRDLWFNVMPYASDDYVTKLIQTVNSKLDPKLRMYIEFGNEWWNGTFPIFGLLEARYRQRTGAGAPQSGAESYSHVIAELVFQHNALMTKVEGLIPNWQTRVVRVLNIQAGQAAQYGQFKEAGGSHIDFVANAPYFNYVDPAGNNDPASVMAGWIASGIAAIRDLRSIADAVYADGRRFGCYEGGTGAVGLNFPTFLTLKQSPQWYYIFRAYFEEWRNQFGDLFLQFDDMQMGWGLLNYQGSTTNYGVMAMTDAIAGNYAHRPAI